MGIHIGPRPTSNNQFFQATGGTVTDIEQDGVSYRVHTFTSSGTFEVTNGTGEVEYLVVAGGGGGAASAQGSGGGGAGGVITGSINVENQNYSVIVGSGGLGVRGESFVSQDANGNDSSIFGLTSIGGGGGGFGANQQSAPDSFPSAGASGGSGGGGGTTNAFFDFAGGSGVPGQGNVGGSGFGSSSSNERGTGGGGGAGSPGTNAAGDFAGNGGVGIAIDISGSLEFFGGGGGGGSIRNNGGGLGGLGGGGQGGGGDQSVGNPGAPNTGGGAGSGFSWTTNLVSNQIRDGGSGIVIVRYPRDPDATYSQPDRTISSTLPGNFNIIQDGLVFNVDANDVTSYNGSGNTWVDQTGFGNNGSLQNSPSFQQEFQGYFAFNGSNQWVSVPTSNDSTVALSNFGNMTGDDTNAWSVEVWFRTLSVFGSSERTGAPLFYRDDGDLYAGMIVYNGFLRWAHYNNGWETDITSNTFVSDGVWHHAVYVNFSNSTGNLYVDGRLEVSGATSSMNDGRYFIPSAIARGYQNTFLDGDIAAARLYDKSLSKNEVTTNFNVTRGRFGV